ncbi:MAG: hypothetical protein J3K34DRAFT_434291 [Monoraphidium minutum]|nr:MAG: hypothetical protein J3K34DRAFT_434291 [Monoraphidium minutum]
MWPLPRSCVLTARASHPIHTSHPVENYKACAYPRRPPRPPARGPFGRRSSSVGTANVCNPRSRDRAQPRGGWGGTAHGSWPPAQAAGGSQSQNAKAKSRPAAPAAATATLRRCARWSVVGGASGLQWPRVGSPPPAPARRPAAPADQTKCWSK